MAQEINLLEKTIEVISLSQPFRPIVKKAIEGLLFSASEPLPLQKIKEIIEAKYSIKSKELLELIYELQQEYHKQDRAFRIEEIGGGFLLRTVEDVSFFVDILLQGKRTEKLSRAATEVLAIIAYRGPVTRNTIEGIRGVDCSGAVASLMERQLIEIAGRLEVPGKPCLYAVTKKFLNHFGLSDLKELTQNSLGEKLEALRS